MMREGDGGGGGLEGLVREFKLNPEAFDSFVRTCLNPPAPSERLRQILAKQIARPRLLPSGPP